MRHNFFQGSIRLVLLGLVGLCISATAQSATTTIVAKHSAKCLDVSGGTGATANGVQIDQWTCTGQTNQAWTLKDAGNGQYQLIAQSSGKCLDVPNGSTTDGVILQQWDCAPGAKQFWTLQTQPGGYAKIVSAVSGKCVDVAGGSSADFQKVQQWTCLDVDNQQWSLQVPGQTTTVVAKHSGKCLDIVGPSSTLTNGAKTDQTACTGQPDQIWKFKDAGNGQYQIIVNSSGKCLDLPSGQTANGVVLQQWDCAPGTKQLWRLQTEFGGYSKIISVASGKCVDVAGMQTTDGAYVQQWDCLNQDNQRWLLTLPDNTPPAPYVGPISAKHSGKCVDVSGGATAVADGTPIDQWACTGELNQRWTVKDTGGGKYQLIAASSNKCIQVPGANPSNGVTLQQQTCSTASEQLWTMTNETGGYHRLISAATGKCIDVAGIQTTDGALVQQWDCLNQDNQLWLFATGTPPVGSTSGPFGQDASQYVLAFSDEFENGFDSSKWNNKIWYESSNPTINYRVENGSLKIWPQRDANGNFFNRTIDTDGKYYQTYGYFEVEAKLPVGKGTWPAFWLLNHDDSTARPEIDIMEAYAGGGPSSGWSDSNYHPTTYGATTHWPESSVIKLSGSTDLSAGFHKYGCKWTANSVSFYFDGKLIGTTNVSMPSRMYILLDLWFGAASGTPDNSTPTGVGNSYEVRYVRAWKFK